MSEQHNKNSNNEIDRKSTLEEIKSDWLLNYNGQIVKIASLIEKEYKNYISKPFDYQGNNIDFASLLYNCEGMKAQLIPYSYLTGIIFQNDMKSELSDNKLVNESNFADIIEGEFEKYLV
ncbi:hypothetical protein ACVV5W_14310, partial [Enterococcus faecalis]